MTANELIEKLRELPEQAEIMIAGENGSTYNITGLEPQTTKLFFLELELVEDDEKE